MPQWVPVRADLVQRGLSVLDAWRRPGSAPNIQCVRGSAARLVRVNEVLDPWRLFGEGGVGEVVGAPVANFDRYRACPSSADHLPSGPRVRFATRTYVCRCGSPARLVRCRNPAAINPTPGSRRVPNYSKGAAFASRLLDPRRTKHASSFQPAGGSACTAPRAVCWAGN